MKGIFNFEQISANFSAIKRSDFHFLFDMDLQ